MKILYLLNDGLNASSSEWIEALAGDRQIEVIDLGKKEIPYDALVDKIFASDKVISWWCAAGGWTTTCGRRAGRERNGTHYSARFAFPAALDVRGGDRPLAHAAVMLLSLAAFLTLFVLRAQDDNRLTSWRWVFSDADVFRIRTHPGGRAVAGP